jgi:hypothetical protein
MASENGNGEKEIPLGNGGRDRRGRFTVGNTGGPGNPHGARIERIRAMLFDAATDDEIRKICRVIVERAAAGELKFVREYLNRTIGKPMSGDQEERFRRIEAILDQEQEDDD